MSVEINECLSWENTSPGYKRKIAKEYIGVEIPYEEWEAVILEYLEDRDTFLISLINAPTPLVTTIEAKEIVVL